MPTPNLIELSPEPLKRLFTYLRPYRAPLTRAIGNSFINKVLDLAPPVLVGWAVDTVSRQPPYVVSSIAGSEPLHQGLVLGTLAVLIFGFEGLFQWLHTVGFMRVAQAAQHDLRIDAYTQMQSREMAFFENHRVGETMSMLSDDVNQMERFLNTVFNDIVQMVALFIISAVILLSQSPMLTLVAIIPIPLIVWGSLYFQKLLGPYYTRMRQAVGHVNTRLENNIGGIAVIKAFTAEIFERDRLEEVSKLYRERNIDAIKMSALFVPLIRMGVSGGFGAVLVFGTIWTLDGSITPGTFTLFGMMSQRILWPLTRLGNILDETERCRASAARIFGLLDSPSRIVDAADATSLGRVKGKIDFRGVHFAYGQGPEILRGLDFSIAPGEVIGIAGATGAGKSTLVKLLLRLYEPSSGKITLDDQDLQSITLKSLRQNIALVSQDVYLFQGTIAENIRYGAAAYDQASIEQAAGKAQLHEFICSLPEGYETLVGERGIKLSGGQRQRLSIARAMLRDAPVFILDEATSSVDTETERDIQRGLSEFTKNRTAIIIAHRLSTIRKADRILVLDQGKLVEQGSHDQLVAKAGIYCDLWTLQSGDV